MGENLTSLWAVKLPGGVLRIHLASSGTAAVLQKGQSRVHLLDANAANCVGRQLQNLEASVSAAATSCNGTELVLGLANGEVQLWDVELAELIHRQAVCSEGIDPAVQHIAMSRSAIAVACSRHVTILGPTCELLLELPDTDEPVNALAWIDEDVLAVASRDQVCIWCFHDGMASPGPTLILDVLGEITSISVSCQGDFVAAMTDDLVHIWGLEGDMVDGKLMPLCTLEGPHDEQPSWLGWRSNSNHVMVAFGSELYVWDISLDSAQHVCKPGSAITCCGFDAGSVITASAPQPGGGPLQAAVSDQGQVLIFDCSVFSAAKPGSVVYTSAWGSVTMGTVPTHVHVAWHNASVLMVAAETGEVACMRATVRPAKGGPGSRSSHASGAQSVGLSSRLSSNAGPEAAHTGTGPRAPGSLRHLSGHTSAVSGPATSDDEGGMGGPTQLVGDRSFRINPSLHQWVGGNGALPDDASGPDSLGHMEGQLDAMEVGPHGSINRGSAGAMQVRDMLPGSDSVSLLPRDGGKSVRRRGGTAPSQHNLPMSRLAPGSSEPPLSCGSSSLQGSVPSSGPASLNQGMGMGSGPGSSRGAYLQALQEAGLPQGAAMSMPMAGGLPLGAGMPAMGSGMTMYPWPMTVNPAPMFYPYPMHMPMNMPGTDMAAVAAAAAAAAQQQELFMAAAGMQGVYGGLSANQGGWGPGSSGTPSALVGSPYRSGTGPPVRAPGSIPRSGGTGAPRSGGGSGVPGVREPLAHLRDRLQGIWPVGGSGAGGSHTPSPHGSSTGSPAGYTRRGARTSSNDRSQCSSDSGLNLHAGLGGAAPVMGALQHLHISSHSNSATGAAETLQAAQEGLQRGLGASILVRDSGVGWSEPDSAGPSTGREASTRPASGSMASAASGATGTGGARGHDSHDGHGAPSGSYAAGHDDHLSIGSSSHASSYRSRYRNAATTAAQADAAVTAATAAIMGITGSLSRSPATSARAHALISGVAGSRPGSTGGFESPGQDSGTLSSGGKGASPGPLVRATSGVSVPPSPPGGQRGGATSASASPATGTPAKTGSEAGAAPQPGAATTPQQVTIPPDCTNVYVGNLAQTVGVAALEAVFGQFGSIVAAEVIYDKVSGKSKGFAFIQFSSPLSASMAIQHMHGVMLEGPFQSRSVKVLPSFKPVAPSAEAKGAENSNGPAANDPALAGASAAVASVEPGGAIPSCPALLDAEPAPAPSMAPGGPGTENGHDSSHAILLSSGSSRSDAPDAECGGPEIMAPPSTGSGAAADTM